MKVAIVTPTIGSEHLAKCIGSVDNQTYQDITHYIFIDGAEHAPKVNLELIGASKVKVIELEENVGKGWYGHRVYAACSFLVNADVIIYLDEDNWLEHDHVEKLVDKFINSDVQWAYSLRKIYDEDENLICEDNCESLGKWPVYFNDKVNHIDTSCFAIRKEVAVAIGHAWYGQWGADRQFFNALKQYYPNYICSNAYTLNYRLGGNEGSVKKEFFIEGNKVNNEKYKGEYPWKENQHLLQAGPVTLVLT